MIPVHYRINPSGASTSLSTDQIIAAIKAGIAAWVAVNPQVQFVYDGTTSDHPAKDGVSGDPGANFNNVVGFVLMAATASADRTPKGPNASYGAFDIRLNATRSWDWRPCNPSAGDPCNGYQSTALDLQAIVEHEWGHVLGLDHPPGTQAQYLTMFGSGNSGDRFSVTLGLGDILGIRKLYPTSAPMPTIYNP